MILFPDPCFEIRGLRRNLMLWLSCLLSSFIFHLMSFIPVNIQTRWFSMGAILDLFPPDVVGKTTTDHLEALTLILTLSCFTVTCHSNFQVQLLEAWEKIRIGAPLYSQRSPHISYTSEIPFLDAKRLILLQLYLCNHCKNRKSSWLEWSSSFWFLPWLCRYNGYKIGILL